ncbi:isochorismatase hydrolase [Rhodopirellula maiorica SM1]|uniref:Isochorismatase hydrolase n=1 Tax=Rhodopirellula maiorica SM1 TaxID=1265738 RepID=M5RL89_9BACT|nr:isochorismatase family cysteine hydrolase [Rhodopirellula maiorica]EMI16142.1 isochorismatase hydrolase [Rhodopirellula maiorica SM1]
MSLTDSDSQFDETEQSTTALLIVDMINDLEFDEGEQLLDFALPVAKRLQKLKKRFAERGWPVIYANDNFGKWQSDFRGQVDHCLHDNVCGKAIVELLVPQSDDYFVLKPMHSAFYGTTLDILLKKLGVNTLVITGVATNICILFTANDAYMRGYQIWIPGDCVAANTADLSEAALEQARMVLKANTTNSAELDLDKLE